MKVWRLRECRLGAGFRDRGILRDSMIICLRKRRII